MDEIEYSKIPVYMKRYSLESKMFMCTNLSLRLTSPTRPTSEKIRSAGCLSHELEAYFTFAIMSAEYSEKIFASIIIIYLIV